MTFKMIYLSAFYINWRLKDYVQLVLDCPDDVPWCCQTMSASSTFVHMR